jgi:Zn-dependent peptidase ImmA (M78 family)
VEGGEVMTAEETRDAVQAKLDAEANAFAMELLMPEEWLRADMAKIGGIDIDDDKTIKKLAHRYRVSPNVMLVRLAQLSDRFS